MFGGDLCYVAHLLLFKVFEMSFDEILGEIWGVLGVMLGLDRRSIILCMRSAGLSADDCFFEISNLMLGVFIASFVNI